MASLKRILQSVVQHTPSPPVGEKRAFQKLAVVFGTPAVQKLRGGVGHTGVVTLCDSVLAGVISLVVAVYLYHSLAALEMQERWSLELYEEEKRAIIDRMTINMSQRVRVGGFIVELHPRAADPPALVACAPGALRRLTLVSAAQEGFTDDSLKAVLHATTHPVLKTLSGHVLYIPPFISFVAEGDSADVAEFFRRAWPLEQHHTLCVAADQKIKTRLFPSLEEGVRATTILPYQGFKGTIIVSIFRSLGHRFASRTMYAPKANDVPEGCERRRTVLVLRFPALPENWSCVSDSVMESVVEVGGELLFAGIDRLVCAFAVEADVVAVGLRAVSMIERYIHGTTLGAAVGTIRRAPFSSRLHVGRVIEHAAALALEARHSRLRGLCAAGLHGLRPDLPLRPDGTAFGLPTPELPGDREEPMVLPHVVNSLPELQADALVRATILSYPRHCASDLAAQTHTLIHNNCDDVVTDKMILVKSQQFNLVLFLLEGHVADIMKVYAILKRHRLHKYCFLSGLATIEERIFSSEFAPMQIVSGDQWCVLLKHQIKLLRKSSSFTPSVLQRFANANQFPSGVGMLPVQDRAFATLLPSCRDMAGLAACYRKVATGLLSYSWIEIVETTQRLVVACKRQHALHLVRLCIAFSKLIKESAWGSYLAVGIASGDALSGHVGKQHPIFFVSGQAIEQSWEMASAVLTTPNAFGSSMLVCEATAHRLRQCNPQDKLLGIGSNGLHALPAWGVYSIDHPSVDLPSRSLDSPYYLCKRPLQKVLPAAMLDNSDSNVIPQIGQRAS